ncbi:MAG: hypothetical protein K6C35_09905 [Eubacterium sp.]|nr:hypothetical protein [Eubacterium sp.]
MAKHYKKIFLIIFSIFFGIALFVGSRDTKAADEDKYLLNATGKKVKGEDSYDITVTAYSSKNISGYVRISVINNTNDSIAYDTKISIPADTDKTFTVRIPVEGNYQIDNMVNVALLDDKKNRIYGINLPELFSDTEKTVTVGVLSNEFSKLSYLTSGNGVINRVGEEYELEYLELTKDNLSAMLDDLNYLIIDGYDTDLLSATDISRIQKYVSKGGILIIGTGKNDGLSMKGFDKDFIDAEVKSHQKSSFFNSTTVDFATILFGSSYYYSGYGIDGYYKKQGRGVLYISNVSLTDDGLINYPYTATLVNDVLEITYNGTAFYYDYDRYQMGLYTLEGYFDYIEGLKKVSFTGLKWIIFIYVLIVGPVLYIVLKKLNKREFFWVAVPAVTIISMIVVMIYAGRFRLSEKNVTNITIMNNDGSGMRKTYSAAFSSKKSDIEFEIGDSVSEVGSFFDGLGRYNGRQETPYIVTMNGSSTKAEHRGSAPFEKGYFVFKSENEESGNIKVVYDGTNVDRAEITNYTENDFDYYLITCNSDYVIVKGGKPGETTSVFKDIVYYGSFYGSNDALNVPRIFANNDKHDSADIAAILMGMEDIFDDSGDYVIGLTKDYKRLTKGDINETSYGLYYNSIEPQDGVY